MPISQVITALPTPPNPATDSSVAFSTKAQAFTVAQAAMGPELNTFKDQANALETNVNAKEAAAAVSADTASAASTAALAVAGAAMWVSGTTYAIGDARFSPLDLQTYRRRTAGAGTADPSLDVANWAALGGSTAISSALDGLAKNVAIQSFMLSVVGSLTVQRMVDGVVDQYEDQLGVDDANSSATYDAVLDCYTTGASYNGPGGSGNRTASITVTTDLAITDGVISNLVNGGLTAIAGHAVQWTYSGAIAGKYIRFDFGASVARIITEATMRAVTPESATRGFYKWQGSNNGSSWTDVSTSQQLANSVSNVFPFTNSTAYRYYQMVGVSGGIDCASGMSNAWTEIDFKVSSGATGSVLSDPVTATVAPSSAAIVVWEEDIDVSTLNTDVLAFVSREAGVTFTTSFATNNKLTAAGHGFSNGQRIGVTASAQVLPTGLLAATVYYVVNASTDDFELSLTSGGATVVLTANGTGTQTARRYAQATLEQATTAPTGRILTGTADLSAQTSGTAMRYLLVGANSKAVRFDATSLQWK